MMTRQDYMARNSAGDGMKAHRDYYGEIVREIEAHRPLALPATVDEIRAALEADEHLNNIPLIKWDSSGMAQRGVIAGYVRKRDPGGCSLGDLVCVLKEAARQRAEASD